MLSSRVTWLAGSTTGGVPRVGRSGRATTSSCLSRLAEHGEALRTTIVAYHAADSELAERLWKGPSHLSQAWSANYAALGFLQHAGLARFSPGKP